MGYKDAYRDWISWCDDAEKKELLLLKDEKEIEDRLRLSDGEDAVSNIENGNFASNEPWDGAMDAALGLDNFDRDEKGIPLGVKKVPASEAKAGSPEMAKFLEKMKAEEGNEKKAERTASDIAEAVAGRGESEGPDAGASKEGRAEFTLDDINAELDDLMAGKSAAAAEPEVVNVPMEAVSEADQDDGRLRDGTVVKIR